ncbi:LURP-one-related [Dillenia turbinata]|uniref:LURP-one-related n=1 Tax=Dillenia turbinata TaxID=194707 RepID=A0AAN8ZPA1_9MAGN
MTSGRRGYIVNERFCYAEEIHLTIHKTCHFFPGDGFDVYHPETREIVFRVELYGPDSHSRHDLFLMDSSGVCLLTLHPKILSLRHRWEGYVGEKSDGQQPIFSVHRSSIIGRSSILVDVFADPREEYQIEGSYPDRSCAVYRISSSVEKEESKERVAEIKRKVDPSSRVLLGKDVFLLCLEPGFDAAFAMGLVLILDQLYGDDPPMEFTV